MLTKLPSLYLYSAISRDPSQHETRLPAMHFGTQLLDPSGPPGPGRMV